MTVAFLGLGSNIQPEKNINEAAKALSKFMKITRVSTVYLTEPLLNKKQPKYYNCVFKIETDIPPKTLKFDVIRRIEEELGRKRMQDKYASRTIDIDILIYGDLCLSEKSFKIPDPEIAERSFLALPLFELQPDLILPCSGQSIKQIASRFPADQMVPLRGYSRTLQNLVGTLTQ